MKYKERPRCREVIIQRKITPEMVAARPHGFSDGIRLQVEKMVREGFDFRNWRDSGTEESRNNNQIYSQEVTMNRKVTKNKFLEVIENNTDNKPDYELARELSISREWFSKLKRRYADEITRLATDMAKLMAVRAVNDLIRQSKNGNTSASRILLEMAGAYTPSQKHLGDKKQPMRVLVLPERELIEEQQAQEEQNAIE